MRMSRLRRDGVSHSGHLTGSGQSRKGCNSEPVRIVAMKRALIAILVCAMALPAAAQDMAPDE